MREPEIEPVTEVKRNATKIIARLNRTRQPILVTEHGRSAAMLVDVVSYNDMVTRMDLLEGIACGERAIAEGRVTSHTAAKKRVGRWLADVR